MNPGEQADPPSEERWSYKRRPSDSDYYLRQPRPHHAQGDIFRDIPFRFFLPEGVVTRQVGERQPPATVEMFTSFGILLSHSCSFLAQPPPAKGGERGYSQPFREVAAIVAVDLLVERGAIKPEQRNDIVKADRMPLYMYIPPIPGELEGEFAALLYRPHLLHEAELEGKRVAALAEPGARHLQRKLVQSKIGATWEWKHFNPPMENHWE